ncbi:hypothetical protein KTO58_03325 [Chitinophaga pendula]|uniref:hypothetical protein n=1 Tax=Chitinophaga TaxID=79328 RepID=UPI0012FDB8A3|nr:MULTISPECIES: hypothetical protein [Chitinophaga]UCJ08231.1 hypothetical protein KTO58_03325 [Chitinophaga pendula]
MKKITQLGTKLSRHELIHVTGGGLKEYARPACLPGGICPVGQCCWNSSSCWPIGTPGRLCDPPQEA